MDLIYINQHSFTCCAYLDTLPRGFGFDREPGYWALRLGRIVVEWGAGPQ